MTEPENLAAYLKLARSYVHGFVRFASARVAALSLLNVVLEYRTTPREGVSDHPYRRVLERVEAIAPSEYSAFEYVNDLQALVYLTTLLDTFLSDTTKFLLLLHPMAIGRKHTVLLEAVLAARSPADIVNQAAQDKVREVSYLPIAGRIAFIRAQFGLELNIGEHTLVEVMRLWERRNIAVHDQGVFECETVDGRIQVRQKGCLRHPTPVSPQDVRDAQAAYGHVIAEVYRVVVNQVLKGGVEPEAVSVQDLLDDLQRSAERQEPGDA